MVVGGERRYQIYISPGLMARVARTNATKGINILDFFNI